MTSTIEKYIGSELSAFILKLFKQTDAVNEFEFMLFKKRNRNLTLENYITFQKYFNNRIKYDNKCYINNTVNTLEIIYMPSDIIDIRCILEEKDITTYMKRFSLSNNHVKFSSLAKLWNRGDKNINFLKKEKTIENTVDILEFDIRARLSKENKLTKEDINMILNLDETNMNKIVYRYKQRTSLIVHKNADEICQIDLTLTKTNNDFKYLNNSIENYELEIEYGTKSKVNTEILTKMYNEMEILYKIVQQSNFIITNTEINFVLDEYYKLLSIDKRNSNTLDGRRAVSLEIQHLTEKLPNNYTVSDKADGERHFLVIINNEVYLISWNMHVRKTGIVLDKIHGDKYNGSIMDGEYVFLPKYGRYLFLIFDCLRNGHTDIRKIIKINDRLDNADDIIQNCFSLGNQKGFKSKFKYVDSKFDLTKYVALYEKDIELYMSSLNHDIEIEKKMPLIRKKYFVPCLGGKNWEIFSYSLMLWNSYTINPAIKCPYLLDGLIYHPLEQAYITNAKESSREEYKWKPPTQNSIDFYIEFQKDPKTGKILTLYDNSNDEYIRNKPYQICNLYVGQYGKNGRQPLLFKEEQDLHMAYLFLNNGKIRDLSGDSINDKTVVEFYYNNNIEVPVNFRWVPIRTRHDKTDGNYHTIADKVWRSIINPILISDFDELSKGNASYDNKINEMRSKIGHDIIVSSNKENVYYQQNNEMIKPMRNFHNWIKSCLIYTYCSNIYKSNKQLSILDLGMGRGGEINKYYYAKVDFVVGTDIDKETLLSANDGCLSRYNNEKKKRPNYPKMYFIHADSSAKLNYESQEQALKGMTVENKNLMLKFFSSDNKKILFDRINCMFSIHYSLKDQISWDNYKHNINTFLRNDGYFTFCTFEASKVVELIGSKDRYTHYYTTDKGEQKILFEIVKKYEDVKKDTIIGVGNAIDVFLPWISNEGRYMTEYLVDKNFIVKDLLESCNLELVDSDNFENQLNIHKDFLNNFAKYESKPDTHKYLDNVKNFYNKNEINEGCWIYNSLTRYYVFKKLNKNISGGKKDVMYDFSSSKQFYVPDMNDYDADFSFLNSIHQLVKHHKYIPKNVSPDELFSDLNINVKKDIDINDGYIRNFGKKLIIENEIDGEKLLVVDKINIFVVERDCNNYYDIDNYGNQKGKSIILMKEGGMYLPVYHIDNNKNIKGFFSSNNDLIKWMNDNI